MKLRSFTCLFVATASLVACFENPAIPDDSELSAVDRASLDYLGTTMSPSAKSIAAYAHGMGPNHFPLAVGNRWAYRRLTAIELFVEGEEDSLELIRGRVRERMTETVELFGREYVVSDREIDEGELYGVHHELTRYRQDRDGLYEADISDVQPAKARAQSRLDLWRERVANSDHAPAILNALEQIEQKLAFMATIRGAQKDVLEREIQRLGYPLTPGQSWLIREDGSFSSTVEGVQRLRTPAGIFVAWRIRIDSVFFGPNDRVYLFVGRQGFLGHAFRTEGILTDMNGVEIGSIRWHEREALVGLRLVGS